MNKKLSTALFGLGFVALFAISFFLYNQYKDDFFPEPQLEANAEPEEEDTTAPDFTVINNDGEEVKLCDMFGKPIVLNFWASWCPPCQSEMPDFDTVYNELGDEITFMMVALAEGSRETVETAKEFIDKNGFSFPVYYDTEQEAAYTYGVSSIPMSIFINAEGKIITYASGAINESTLRKGIELIRKKEI